MKLFALEGPVQRFFETVFNIMVLHVLWVIFSLPLVTIGASTSALYSVMLKVAKGEEGYVYKQFYKAFKENFKNSTILWLGFALVIAWCVFMIRVSFFSQNALLHMTAILEAAVLFLVVCAMQYVFALAAYFENRPLAYVKNAIYLSMKYLPRTLLLIAVWMVPVIITGFVPSLYGGMLFLWVFVGSGAIAYAGSFILLPIFKKEQEA